MRRVIPGLDVSAIVEASLAIADAEGVDGLTMRRLAAQLEVTPMAIYHHVASKEQLLDLMADESLKELPPINTSARWDRELQRWFTALHELYMAHPALAQTMTQRPLEGPTATALGEDVLALLTGAGLTDDQAVSAFIALTSYTLGASLYRVSRRQPEPADRHRRLAELTADRTPTAHRLRLKITGAADSQEQFTDGLARLIATYRHDATKPSARRRTR